MTELKELSKEELASGEKDLLRGLSDDYNIKEEDKRNHWICKNDEKVIRIDPHSFLVQDVLEKIGRKEANNN